MRAIILAGGHLDAKSLDRRRIDPSALVVAADGGVRHARTLGLRPVAVIGDMDSALAADLSAAEAAGAAILRHPRHKDATDLELALDYVGSQGATDVLILGALGGRFDMSLANVLLPARPAYRHMRLQSMDATWRAVWLNGPDAWELDGAIGDGVSLIPLGGDVTGVETKGLEYALELETLHLGSTRGISNRIAGLGAAVALAYGRLLCITTPHELTEE